MQKNNITNKITPCCGLPFSVIYWWVSNLTLNSEADRQYLLTQISQNGTLSIDGWKVLINSGTLEADASLTKAEFLVWFDCGKQPTCEQLKLIIEAYKMGSWVGDLSEIRFVNELGVLKITDTAPTTQGIYILSDVGNYTNLGGIITTAEKLNYVYFDGTTWKLISVDMPKGLDGKTIEVFKSDKVGGYLAEALIIFNQDTYQVVTNTATGENPITHPVKFKKIIENVNVLANALGITTIPFGTNFISELSNSLLTNTTLWGDGYLADNGTIAPSNYLKYSKNFYEIPASVSIRLKLSNYGIANVIIYDANFVKIAAIAKPAEAVTDVYEINYITPANAKYIRISHKTSVAPNLISISNNTSIYNIDNAKFITESKAKAQISEGLAKFGFISIPVGTNFISELSNSLITNTTLWGDGYLADNGTIGPSNYLKYSKNFYEIPAGVNLKLKVANYGDAKILIFDQYFNRIASISRPIDAQGSGLYELNYNTQANAKYIKINHNTGVALNLISVSNNTEIISETNRPKSLDLPLLVKQQNKRIKRPIISFVSDDGFSQDWFIDKLNAHGDIKATFAIISSYVGLGGFLTKTQIKELKSSGHDIAGHTVTHPRLAEISEAQMINEIYDCKTYLTNLVGENTVFIPPFGSTNSNVERVISGVYDCSIISTYRLENPSLVGVSNQPPINTYRLHRFSFDVQQNNVSIIAKAKEAVDIAVAQNGWLIFAFHPHYTEYKIGTEGAEMRRAEVDELISYIQSLDVPIMTVSNAFKIWKNLVNIGNKSIDAEYLSVGMDGTENGTLVL